MGTNWIPENVIPTNINWIPENVIPTDMVGNNKFARLNN